MKYLLGLVCIAMVAFNSGCENAGCSDIFLGDFLIDESTKAFFPFQENNTLVFKNQNGEELSFTNIDWFEDNNSIVSFFQCGNETRNLIYTGDIASYRFQSDLFDIIMNYTMAYVQEGEANEQNVVDLVTFTLVHPDDGFFANMSYVTFSRGVTNYPDLEDFETFSNLSLNGNFYSEGFRSVQDKPENLVDLFITATGGVVAFSDTDGNNWTFDRTE